MRTEQEIIKDVCDYVKNETIPDIKLVGWDGNEVPQEQKDLNDKAVNWFETRINYLSTGIDVYDKRYFLVDFINDCDNFICEGYKPSIIVVHLLKNICGMLDFELHNAVYQISQLKENKKDK